MLRASKASFDAFGIDDNIKACPGQRQSSKQSQSTIWHQPVVSVTTHEPGFFLKSMCKKQDNYSKEVAAMHKKLGDLPVGKRIIRPPIPTFANCYDLVLSFLALVLIRGSSTKYALAHRRDALPAH